MYTTTKQGSDVSATPQVLIVVPDEFPREVADELKLAFERQDRPAIVIRHDDLAATRKLIAGATHMLVILQGDNASSTAQLSISDIRGNAKIALFYLHIGERDTFAKRLAEGGVNLIIVTNQVDHTKVVPTQGCSNSLVADLNDPKSAAQDIARKFN